MWLSRKNSINSTPTSPRRSNFNRHSFKNIDDLLADDDKTSTDQPKPKHKPSSPISSSPAAAVAGKRHSVFHRVRLANQFTRTIASPRSKSNHEKPNTKHKSEKSSPTVHKSDKSSPTMHKSEKSSPTVHKTDKSSPKVHKSEKSSPKVHKSEKSSPTVHKSEISSPTVHKSEISSPTVHKSEISSPTVYKSEISSPAMQKSETYSPTVKIPGSEKRVVVYMTSLGAVRPTFDACRAVRSILLGFRVAVDERDLSMDSSFREELQKMISPTQKNKLVGLPRVFIGGQYVGDAEDVRQLSETGELKKLVEGLPAVSRGVCEGCGDFRFVICSDCNGSRKCYRDKGGVFRSCTSCNKNGLIRCSTCWTAKT